jgi:small subunit ribosomal protein S20
LRSSLERRSRNKSTRSKIKTHITKAEKFIETGEVDSATKAVRETIRTLDKAARKGVIHPNNAARRKSRLMRKLNAVLAESANSRGDS